MDPDRGNAEHLFSCLQGRDLFLPQTYVDLPEAKRVTHKEMTCRDLLLQQPRNEDWTTLDFLVAPIGMKQEICVKGSSFQQAVNTRHLPLIAQVCTRIPNKSSSPQEAKLHFSNTKEYYAKVESEFLQSVGNLFDLPVPSRRLLSYHQPRSLPHMPLLAWYGYKSQPTDDAILRNCMDPIVQVNSVPLSSFLILSSTIVSSPGALK